MYAPGSLAKRSRSSVAAHPMHMLPMACEHVDGVARVMCAEPVDRVDVHGTSLHLFDDEKRVPQEPAHLGPRAKVGQPG